MAMGIFVATSDPGDQTHNTLVLGDIEVVIPLEADLDGDPDTPDSVRFRKHDGSFESQLTVGDPGVEKDGDNPLYFYHFAGVSPGEYSIDVKMGDQWHTVLHGLRVTHQGAFVGDVSYEGPSDGSVLGTPDEVLADDLPEDPDEEEIHLCPLNPSGRLCRRLKAAKRNHKKDSTEADYPPHASALQRDRRQGKFHKDPWLRRLYVLWAAPVPPAAEGKEQLSPKFALVQSDDKGYLSRTLTNLDPSGGESLPLIPDTKYLFYFVRHPGDDLPLKVLQQLTEDYAAAQKKWGEPQEIAPEFKATGKSEKGHPVSEGIIGIDEDSDNYIPKGSDFYDGWVLFRDMPGMGSNVHDSDIQCACLRTQVKRLQYHLGNLRYPIGNHNHPYSPEPCAPAKVKKGHKAPKRLYPNEGLFDIVTWSAVLAFQRDAREGNALALNPEDLPKSTLSDGNFDPPDTPEWSMEAVESAKWISTTQADKTKANAAMPADYDLYDTIVEATTGDAIKAWLANDFRKPGKILVAWPAQHDIWMQEDVRPVIDSLDGDLKRLGVRSGAYFTCSFRDARMSVVDPEPGQVQNSIHKSGFAFDFHMAEDMAHGTEEYPLYFVKDENANTGRVRWIVWVKVAESTVAKDEYLEYADSITPWNYDPESETGGDSDPPLFFPGYKFLNFTKVCKRWGMTNISAHKTGWQYVPAQTISADSAANLKEIVKRLGKKLKHPKTAGTVVINGVQEVNVADLKDMHEYLKLWLKLVGRHGTAPELQVEPWTKEGAAVVRALRGNDFKGRKMNVVVNGPWFQTPGTPSPAAADAAVSVGDIELGPKTDFPGLYAFQLRPLTEPITLMAGQTVEFPEVKGVAANMEWWHFQYEAGYEDTKWIEILELIGWTFEGLAGADGGKPIFGHFGLGYATGCDTTQNQGIDCQAI